MDAQQIERLFIGKSFVFEDNEYFCTDVSVNSNAIVISTDKTSIRVAISEFTIFYNSISFGPKKQRNISSQKKEIKPIKKSEFKTTVGNLVKEKRTELGYTIAELGELAGIGKGASRTIGLLEKGESNFTIDTLELILIALNCSFEEIINPKQ